MSELEVEILDKISRDFAREVDNDIIDTSMINVLKSEGWTVTDSNPAYGNGSIVNEIDWYANTAEWIHINATGDYKLIKGRWLFENKEDAVMFTLKWS
jgi:hypothetical protein